MDYKKKNKRPGVNFSIKDEDLFLNLLTSFCICHVFKNILARIKRAAPPEKHRKKYLTLRRGYRPDVMGDILTIHYSLQTIYREHTRRNGPPILLR